MGPPDSHGISRAPCYSGTLPGDPSPFDYRAVTFCGRPFQVRSSRYGFSDSPKGPVTLLAGPTTPTRQRHRAITPHRFRLIPVRSPLLRESRLLSLPRPTEMFQFERFPPSGLCVQPRVTGHDPCRVSPFGYPRIKALLAAPRGFSQPHASFIGSWRLGIHRKPFLTWPIDARARYEVLKVLEALRPRPEGSHPQHRTACPAGASHAPRVRSRERTPDGCATGRRPNSQCST